MKSIIKRYEELSGQAVNFNKSTITFSTNAAVETRGIVSGILDVGEIQNPGRYLGLAMVVGRKKMRPLIFYAIV